MVSDTMVNTGKVPKYFPLQYTVLAYLRFSGRPEASPGAPEASWEKFCSYYYYKLYFQLGRLCRCSNSRAAFLRLSIAEGISLSISHDSNQPGNRIIGSSR